MRTLPDGCTACGFSRNYCDCVAYLDSGKCCDQCSHAVTVNCS